MSKSKVTKSLVKGAPQTPTMIHEHIDNFLAKIVGETPVDDKPRNSTEYWLNEIAENLPGGAGLTMDLLWRNPNIVESGINSMSATDITVSDMTSYKMILIRTINGTSFPFRFEEFLFKVSLDNSSYIYKMNGLLSSGILARRYFNITSATKIHFLGGFIYNTYASNSQSDSALVPYEIYGIK